MSYITHRKKENKEKTTNQYIETRILCSASEIGKHIINGCLNRGYHINTPKLEKLLVIAYGIYLCRTNKKLFKEDIELWKDGPRIKNVDEDFGIYSIRFNRPFVTWYPLWDEQEDIINEVIKRYGRMDADYLNKFGINALVEHNKGEKVVSEESTIDVFTQFA